MEAKPLIQFKNVTKNFENMTGNAVDDISFDIYPGEFITILGSSGSGKTTTLKMINRLIDPDKGEIFIQGENIGAKDAVELRKHIGYVVQQIGLFPHMKVGENIAVVPKLLSWDNGKISKRVDELLDLVGLSPEEYRDRYPQELSGGQQQRVGVARALAANPDLMLLDEPLGAIDAINRASLQKEIKRIHKEMKDKTFVLVTHDIIEAFFLGSRIMIMNEGKICRFDTPDNILKNPGDGFVKDLMDTLKEQQKMFGGLL